MHDFLIVTPVLNGARYVAECVNSVRKAFAGRDFVHLLVDGGSTDETVELAKTLQDGNFSVLEAPGTTMYQALNVGILKCPAKIFYQLNVDDLLFPEAVEKVAESLDGGPLSPMILSGGSLSVYENAAQYRLRASLNGWSVSDSIQSGIFVQQPSTFIDTRVFKIIGLFSEKLRFAGDSEFWLRAQKHSVPFKFCDMIFSVDRIHGSNARFSSTHVNELDGLMSCYSIGIVRKWVIKFDYIRRSIVLLCNPLVFGGVVKKDSASLPSAILGFFMSLSIPPLRSLSGGVRVYGTKGRLR